MKTATALMVAALLTWGRCAAQEAERGIDLRATVAAEPLFSSALTRSPRNGSLDAAGFRAIAYPTLKFNSHWTVTGAWEGIAHPYYYQSFGSSGYGFKGYLLQAGLSYARVSDERSVLVRAGQMTSAFGSFLLRYDDADNPLAGMPLQYGYYRAVSAQGLAALQLDATRGRFDGRLSLPIPRRRIRAASSRTISMATGPAAAATPFARVSASVLLRIAAHISIVNRNTFFPVKQTPAASRRTRSESTCNGRTDIGTRKASGNSS